MHGLKMSLIVVFRRYNASRRIILGFKCIRFKSSTSEERICKLAEILDCNTFTARQLISKNNNIKEIEIHTLVRNAYFCHTHFKLSEIVELPTILSIDSSVLQHRYFSLLEVGVSNVCASYLLRFSRIMDMTPEVMKKKNINIKVSNSLKNIEKIPVSDLNNYEISAVFQKMFKENKKLSTIKSAMNAEFLCVKLNCTLFKANQILNRCSTLKSFSILILDEMINILFKELHLPSSKILQSPALLLLHPEAVQMFLGDATKILNVDITELAYRLPLLLKRPLHTVLELEKILEDFNITDQQLLSCPKVLTFTPSTLKSRLEFVCQSEDFSFLKSYKKFLWLVYHFSKLQPRLSVLKARHLPQSINVFIASESNFGKYLSYSQSRSHVQDVCQFLSKALSYSESDVLLKLRTYPHFNSANLPNAVQVVRFLLNSGVSKKQIFNGVGVVLYKVTVVKEFYSVLPSYPECQPFSDWLSHENFMQLLIYAIEINGRSESAKRLEEQKDDDSEIESYA